MTIAIVVTVFELGLVNADGNGRIDEVIPVRAPQLALVGIELVMDFPEGVHILTADTVRGGVSIQTGIAMIQHGPVHEAEVAGINICFDDIWFCA